MSIIQYPFLSLYAVTVQPIITRYSRFKNHREYHELIDRSNKERSALLKDLIQTQAELTRCKDLHALKIPYEGKEKIVSACTAQIIYRQLHQKDSFFLIDKGSHHGVSVDMLAVLDNVLLGRIVAVYPWYSKIIPTTDLQCHVPIICSTSRAHGVFHGNKLDFVSHLEPLVVGELVITSGDGLIYPQGLAVGRIKNFTLNDLGFLYEVAVEPLYDITTLRYCSIVSKNTQQARELL